MGGSSKTGSDMGGARRIQHLGFQNRGLYDTDPTIWALYQGPLLRAFPIDKTFWN